MFSTSPLLVAEITCAVFAAGCWVGSLITGNCSQVDRLWSFAPPIYVIWFAAAADFADPRLDEALVLELRRVGALRDPAGSDDPPETE